MVVRSAKYVLSLRLRDYPAALLVGPRQCGKTTLAKTTGGLYFDLEQPADRLRLDLEWQELIAAGNLVIFDEAQAMPELFPRLRGAIDQDRSRHGRFLLLGSVAPALMTHVSESLAGRLALVELTPFSLAELPETDPDTLWLYGGFPQGGILQSNRFPHWQQNYLDLLCQRDLPAWGLPAKPTTTHRLLEMLAAVHGQTWNASQLGQSLGLSYHTVNGYTDYLDGAFLTRRLYPYFTSTTKRLAKTPKVYLRDSGLLHALLAVSDRAGLLRQPWVGASWEGFVIEQIIRHLQDLGRPAQSFFLRTHDHQELDLLLIRAERKWAFEIKLTTSPSQHDLRRLNHCADLVGAQKRFLISQTNDSVGGPDTYSCNLRWLVNFLEENWT